MNLQNSEVIDEKAPRVTCAWHGHDSCTININDIRTVLEVPDEELGAGIRELIQEAETKDVENDLREFISSYKTTTRINKVHEAMAWAEAGIDKRLNSLHLPVDEKLLEEYQIILFRLEDIEKQKLEDSRELRARRLIGRNYIPMFVAAGKEFGFKCSVCGVTDSPNLTLLPVNSDLDTSVISNVALYCADDAEKHLKSFGEEPKKQAAKKTKKAAQAAEIETAAAV